MSIFGFLFVKHVDAKLIVPPAGVNHNHLKLRLLISLGSLLIALLLQA
jgi:hypothetical protein